MPADDLILWTALLQGSVARNSRWTQNSAANGRIWRDTLITDATVISWTDSTLSHRFAHRDNTDEAVGRHRVGRAIRSVAYVWRRRHQFQASVRQ